jgi:hypothetical protein
MTEAVLLRATMRSVSAQGKASVRCSENHHTTLSFSISSCLCIDLDFLNSV